MQFTDAENRFDKKYLTPENGYYRALQLMGAPYIEEVKPDDDDFGDNKGSVVSTTAGSDNFHAEVIDFHKIPRIIIILNQ
jgi:hypothetical protein